MADQEQDIIIPVGGDISEFEGALDSLPSMASAAAAAVNDAFGDTSGVDGMRDSFEGLGGTLAGFLPETQKVIDSQAALVAKAHDAEFAFYELAQAFAEGKATSEQVTRAQIELAAAYERAYPVLKKTGEAALETSEEVQKLSEVVTKAKEVAEAFAAIALAEKLTELATEAVHAYGEQERLATALEHLGGSAQVAADQMAWIDKASVELGVSQSMLEGQAMKLARTFGPGDGLTGVMKSALDVSAATGQSFESVAGSLERVEVSGAVSTRQLMALGLSWTDLAKTMGTSIEQAQKMLKSGAQSAEQDVQVLLDTIKTKYGQAAAEQAGQVLNQIQSLRSATDSLMEDLGKAIAPAASAIVSTIKTDILPAVKQAIDAFEHLSPPVKEFLLIAGGLSLAVVPLAAALAAVGFALGGLEKLGATTAAGFRLLSGAQTATAATAEAVTVEEGRAAQTIARVAVVAVEAAEANAALAASQAAVAATAEAETVAQTTLATSMQGSLISAAGGAGRAFSALSGIISGLAFVAAAYAIEQLVSASIKAVEATRNLEAVTRTETDTLTKLELQLKQQGINIDELSRQYHGGEISIETYRLKIMELVKAFREANPYVEDAGVKQDRLAFQVTKAANAISEATSETKDKLQVAATVLEQYRSKLDGSKEAQDNFTRAQLAYNKALEESTPHLKATFETLDQIHTKTQEAASSFTGAKTTYDAALAAFEAGKGTLADVHAAWDQLATKAKAAGQAVYDAAQQMTAAKDKAAAQLATLNNTINTYQALKAQGDKTTTGQLALAEQLKAVETQAKALGLTVDATGNALVFGLSEKAGKAAAGIQLLADQLNNGIIGPVQKVGVIINGQFVPTMQSAQKATTDTSTAMDGWIVSLDKVPGAAGGASSTIRMLRADMDTTAAAASGLADAMVFQNDEWVKSVDLLKQVAAGYKDAAQEAFDAASAVNSLAEEIRAEDAAASSSSGKGGGGGRGGGGSGGTNAATWLGNLLSIASSPLASVGGNFTLGMRDNILGALQSLSGDNTGFTIGSGGGGIGPGQLKAAVEKTTTAVAGLGDAAGSGGQYITYLGTTADKASLDLAKIPNAVDGTLWQLEINLPGGISRVVQSITKNADNLDNLDLSGLTSDIASLVTAGGAAQNGLTGLAGAADLASSVLGSSMAAASASSMAAAGSFAALAADVAQMVGPASGSTPLVNSRGLPPISITVPLQPGLVVGQNGMQQLANIISEKVNEQVKLATNLKLG